MGFALFVSLRFVSFISFRYFCKVVLRMASMEMPAIIRSLA